MFVQSDSRQKSPALKAHRFQFRCLARATVMLGEHKGSAVRGMFAETVRQYCEQPNVASCHQCELVAICPVAHLVSPVEEAGRRGPDVPRPYSIQPPLDRRTRYETGDQMEFGLTLYGRGLNQLRVILGGFRRRGGTLQLGSRVEQSNRLWGRGTITVEEVTVVSEGSTKTTVMDSQDNIARVPDNGVTHEAILARAAAMGDPGALAMRFLTPTRIIDQGRLVQRPAFRPLFQRLVERLSSLWEHYGEGSPPLDYPALMAAAEQVKTIQDETRWIDLESYSSRRGTRTPIGGFAGRAVFQGPLVPLLPWLIWGEYTHVGKNAVKGDGWYTIEKAD